MALQDQSSNGVATSTFLPSPDLRFQALEPDNSRDIAELVRQRHLCGWSAPAIPKWLDNIRKGDRLMYWIFLDNDPNPPTDKETYCQDAPMTNLADFPPFNPGFTPVGHIALDWVDYEGDASLASKENHRIVLSTFFILRSKQSAGLGGKTMNKIEQIAKEELKCTAITLNTPPTHSPKAKQIGLELTGPSDGPIPADWYARRGYKAYKEELRYNWVHVNGHPIKGLAVFMEKKLC